MTGSARAIDRDGDFLPYEVRFSTEYVTGICFLLCSQLFRSGSQLFQRHVPIIVPVIAA